MTTFLDAAYYYAQLGWATFPLVANAKIPAIPKHKGGQGFKDATKDTATLERWAKEYPGCNIGIATGTISNIVVVDIDPRNGGAETMVNLFKKGHVFPPSPEAITGNGGKHLFYKLPPGLKASKDRLGKGIDIKADGGYVVAAPSRIGKSEQGPGGEYKWTYVPMRGQELPPLPQWAIKILMPEQRDLPQFKAQPTSDMAMKELEGMAFMLSRQGQGHRNISLNWAAHYAGKLVKDGLLDPNRAKHRLISAAISSGLPLPEAEAAFKSGFESARK
jgi:hypothetical protein